MLYRVFIRSMIGMKKNSLVVLRIALALAAWWIIYKGYEVFVEPLFIDRIPEVLGLFLRSMLIPYTLGLGVCYLILRGMEKGEILPQMNVTPGLIIKGFFAEIGMAIPCVFIVNIICRILGIVHEGITAEILFGNNWWFYLFQLLIFAPIVEEFLFRKLVIERLVFLGEVPTVIISSLFFALPHIYSQGIPLFFGTFALAMVLGYVRVKTGKLWPCILLHALFNLYGSYFTLSVSQTVPGTILVFALGILVMPTIAVIVMVLHFQKRGKAQIAVEN